MFVAPLLCILAVAPAQKVELPPPPPVAIKAAVLRPAIAGRAIAPPGMPGVGRPNSSGVGGPGDDKLLRNAKLAITDDALLGFFRKRTPPAPSREVVIDLIKKLSSPELTQRDSAQADLTAFGQSAVPLLRTAANNVDEVEGSARARATLANIEGIAGANIVANVARLLASRKPAGAAEVLIGYIPHAEDEATFQEVETALVAVAVREGKPDPALIKALKDPQPIRRGTAAQTICQATGSAYYSSIRPLLKDPRASVRLRAALGLVGAYDAEAIPVMIDLLDDLTPRLRNQAEEYLTQLAGEWAVAGPKGNDQMARKLRRDIWATWWKNTDGSRLLDEFKSRTTNDEELVKIMALIAKLADERAPGVRDTAMNELIAIGRPAASLLRRAASDTDTKVTSLATRCLETIEKDAPSPLPTSAPRLLALRKPEGTVETLLQYLPYCESSEALEQFIDILAAVGCANNNADALLVKSLEDKISIRRSSAALALCRGKAFAQLPAITKLLKDSDPMVRLKASQGLALIGEKEAIPTLIALLKELPVEQVWDIEDYLNQVAGDKAPTEVLTNDPASRAKVVAAWTKWWKENGATADLVKVDAFRGETGQILVVESYNRMTNKGRVMEVSPKGAIKWEINNLQYPTDAFLLKSGNVLIVENHSQLTERDRAGKVVGVSRNYNSIFQAERLRDGTTFLACRNNLMMLDAKGDVTFNHSYTNHSILAARRFRDGSMAYVSYGGQYVKLDRTGKEIKNFVIPNWNGNYNPSGGEILPGDRVVISESRFGKVIAFGPDGKQVWECAVRNPMVPFALSNGNLLVPGDNQTALYEINRNGKIVKETKGLTYQAFRVVRR